MGNWSDFKQIAPWKGWHQLLIWIIALIVAGWITAPFWLPIFHIYPASYQDNFQPCIPDYMGGCD
jgi:hypothetical protein